MRKLTLGLIACVLSDCRCSPLSAQSVTMHIVNTTQAPLYVDATAQRLGLTVQRDVGGTLFGFDDLSCTCRYCSNACDRSCSCPDAGAGQILRLLPGERAQRTWDGVVQVSGSSGCRTDGCLEQQNAPLNEPFTLQWCYSVQKPLGVVWNDAGVGAGMLPQVTVACTSKQFAPQDLEVEISPPQGRACSLQTDCQGEGELCLEGACVTSCPANEFPAVGGDWLVSIASPDDMGFFTKTARSGSVIQWTGVGDLTAVSYQSNTLWLTLARAGSFPGEVLRARVQMKIPLGVTPPLLSPGAVSVTLLDNGDVAQPSRALLIQDASTHEVLVAADMGQNADLLTATDLVPLSVSEGGEVLGCSESGCGRQLYFAHRVTAGDAGVDVLPGKQQHISLGARQWNFLSVSASRAQGTRCSVSRLSPWILWRL